MALKPIRVSQLNAYIHRILQTDPVLGNISVIGEISNLKFHSSGHVYFSLKDENSKINCFLAAQNLTHIRYDLEEGMEIIALGYISVYERGGYYSLNVRDIEVRGEGDLAVKFEQLKNKLDREGIFDKAHKKEIPSFADNIAVVTASTGAALQDILKIVTGKNNYVNIRIFPVKVQGPGAAEEIAEAVDTVNAEFPDTDVIIVGRGGGSLEDLWAFNEEIVARSIYASEIPVISGVGHEIDFTISDMAADMRAETPTAAANAAVPDIDEIRMIIGESRDDLEDGISAQIRKREDLVASLDIAALGARINERIEYSILQSKNILGGMGRTLESMIAGASARTGDSLHRLDAVTSVITAGQHRADMLKQQLDNMDPRNIISKGYGVILNDRGKMVTSAAQIKQKDILRIVVKDGDADVTVDEVRRKTDG
mgnify:CR=1 FL=1|jgi:exodeoxyribonuclease VII, large subunit